MPTYQVSANHYFNHYTKRKNSQDYEWFAGTSSAAPAVAGVAALLLSVDPSLAPDEVKTLLCKNVDPYYSNKYIGTGRLNAYKALADLISDIEVDIRGGLRVKAIIRNEGTVDLTNVTWQIQVKGGILGLKNKTVNGTINIPAGKSVRVHIGSLFGLGNIVINIKAGFYEKTVTGKQRFIFTKIK
jgi:subtilase family serine protease